MATHRGRQKFCHPLASGEATPALGWKGKKQAGAKSVLPPLPLLPSLSPGGDLSCGVGLHWEKQKAVSGIFEEGGEMGFKAGSSAVACPAVLSESGNNPQLPKKKKIPWV